MGQTCGRANRHCSRIRRCSPNALWQSDCSGGSPGNRGASIAANAKSSWRQRSAVTTTLTWRGWPAAYSDASSFRKCFSAGQNWQSSATALENPSCWVVLEHGYRSARSRNAICHLHGWPRTGTHPRLWRLRSPHILDLAVISNRGMKKRDLSVALAIVQANKRLLIEKWESIHG